MGDQYVGEIRAVSFNFPPRGWAFCNGQLLLIAQNQALFSILGTTYGGNGTTNFALPNLQGRTPLHIGQGITLGQQGGEAAHTLTVTELPQHFHGATANTGAADQGSAANNFWSAAGSYAPSGNGAMGVNDILPNGGSQPHENWTPYLVLNFVIALQGIFPSRN